jgi:F-type H+-transporting ATPase subunit epsilon
MSAVFAYTVTTPDGPLATGECDFMVVPTAGGELGVMADHAALVSAVKPGEVRISTGTAPAKTIVVGAGVVEVRDSQVRLFVASGTKPVA